MNVKTNEWTPAQATRCKGTITEEHTSEVKEVFGEEIADKLANAEEGETFLSILFKI